MKNEDLLESFKIVLVGIVCPLTLSVLREKMSTYSDDEGACGQYGNDSIIAKDSACFIVENAPTLIEADSK